MLQSMGSQRVRHASVTELNLSLSPFFFFFCLIFYFLTLQYFICFAIYQHESATDIHVFPILNLPPSSLPIPSLGSSQCTSPKHPVSSIEPGLVTRFIYIIHISMPFSQNIPPSPFPTESKGLFYTSVSLLLSHIQGYCSVQFSHSVLSNSSRSHESQHARPPCPSPTPGVHSDSRPLSQ